MESSACPSAYTASRFIFRLDLEQLFYRKYVLNLLVEFHYVPNFELN